MSPWVLPGFWMRVYCGSPLSLVTQIPHWADLLSIDANPLRSSLIPAAVEKEVPNSCHALCVHHLCCRPWVRPVHGLRLLLSRHVLSLCRHWRWGFTLTHIWFSYSQKVHSCILSFSSGIHQVAIWQNIYHSDTFPRVVLSQWCSTSPWTTSGRALCSTSSCGRVSS